MWTVIILYSGLLVLPQGFILHVLINIAWMIVGSNTWCKCYCERAPFIHDIHYVRSVRWDCIHFLIEVDSLKSVNLLLSVRLLQSCLSICQPMKLLWERPNSFCVRMWHSEILRREEKEMSCFLVINSRKSTTTFYWWHKFIVQDSVILTTHVHIIEILVCNQLRVNSCLPVLQSGYLH